jgi:hypothetical protein
LLLTSYGRDQDSPNKARSAGRFDICVLTLNHPAIKGSWLRTQLPFEVFPEFGKCFFGCAIANINDFGSLRIAKDVPLSYYSFLR